MIRLGILGGGQLGYMLSQAGLGLGIDLRFLDPDPAAPCRIFRGFRQGDFRSYSDVLDFAKSCDILTIEIENVSLRALETLENQILDHGIGCAIYPRTISLRIAKDKLLQKQFFREQGLPTSDFDLLHQEKLATTHWPKVIKAREGGYDGRGVKIVQSEAQALAFLNGSNWDNYFIEDFVSTAKEIAIVAARNSLGEMDFFPVTEMVFDNRTNMLDGLFCPANVLPEIDSQARHIAEEVLIGLDYVGVLAIEMFLDKENKLWINEIAPRVHNSGHHTIEACVTSQFEQHLRAILGWPLGDTTLNRPAAMFNLVGEEGFEGVAKYEGLSAVLGEKDVYPHIYGKEITKPFRKMGHITCLGKSVDDALTKAQKAKSKMRVIA